MAPVQYLLNQVNDLSNRFTECLDAFEQTSLFTGPSVYFHAKTIRLRKNHKRAVEAIEDMAFMESLYATLTAWGMHRMGQGKTKLVDFPLLCRSFQRVKPLIATLEDRRIISLAEEDIQSVARFVWEIISQLEVGIGSVKLIGGSKALHHVLPELLPPIDRQYTLNFFFRKTKFKGMGEEAFTAIFPYLWQIAVQNRKEIEAALSRGGGMNTSPTKVVDNAIVGYQLLTQKAPLSGADTLKPAKPTMIISVRPVAAKPKGEIAEQILWAVMQMTIQGKERFTRQEIYEILQIKNRSSYDPIFQSMRADQPGGAPGVRAEYRGVFKRIERGVYRLTEYGQLLIHEMAKGWER